MAIQFRYNAPQGTSGGAICAMRGEVANSMGGLGDIRVEPVDGGIVLEARDQAQLNKAKEIAEEILLPSGWTRFGLPGGV